MPNLIQVQEELKGAPLQAVMQYANGGNTQVPPYMALAELSRRKQMQQSMPVQAPQQTVADTVKQEVGTMAMMQQQQAAQQAMQQQVPQAAGSGVATLPSEVHTSRGFAGGGIVGFAEGGDTGDDYNNYYGDRGKSVAGTMADPEMRAEIIAKLKKVFGLDKGGYYDEPNSGRVLRNPEAAQSQGDSANALDAHTGVAMPAGDPAPIQPVAAPQQQAKQPAARVAASGGGGSGITALLRGLLSGKQAESPADVLLRKQIEDYNKPAADPADVGIATVTKTRNAAGVKEPEADPGNRISALQKLQDERQRMFEEQRTKRPMQDLQGMLNAFASGNRATKWAAPGQAYLASQKEHQAQDLDQSDKNLAVREKFAMLQDAQQKYIEAYRLGNAKDMEAAAEIQRKARADLQKELITQSVARANANTQAAAHVQGSAAVGLGHIGGSEVMAQAHMAGLGSKEQQLLTNAYKIAEIHPGAKALANAIAERAKMFGPGDPQVKSGLLQLNALVENVVRSQGQKPVATTDTGTPPPGSILGNFDPATRTLK